MEPQQVSKDYFCLVSNPLHGKANLRLQLGNNVKNVYIKGACSDPNLSPTFFQTYGNFGTLNWVTFRRIDVWSGMLKLYVEIQWKKNANKIQKLMCNYFTLDNNYIGWKSDHNSLRKSFSNLEDFGIGTFERGMLECVWTLLYKQLLIANKV